MRTQGNPTPVNTLLKAAGLALGALVCASNSACAEPAKTYPEMEFQFTRCMATVRVTTGTDITVQFMLNRRGALIGKPRITHAQWAGDEADRKASAASIAEGFDHCLPVSITDALGALIAGHMYVYRFRSPATRQERL